MVASLRQNPTAGFSRDQGNAPLITQSSFDYTLYIPPRGSFLHISTGESLTISLNHFSQISDYLKKFPRKSIHSLWEDGVLHPLLSSQNQLPLIPGGSLHYHVSTTPE